jgi:hypothetical protein
VCRCGRSHIKSDLTLLPTITNSASLRNNIEAVLMSNDVHKKFNKVLKTKL